MNDSVLTFSEQASIAYDALQPDDRELVEESLNELKKNPLCMLKRDDVHKLAVPNQHLYALPVTSRIRVIFELSNDFPQVVDITARRDMSNASSAA